MSLHIREKKNKSGSVNIQIVDRKNRGYKVIETIGCAKSEKEKELFLNIANKRVKQLNKKLYPTLFDIDETDNSDNLEFINLKLSSFVKTKSNFLFIPSSYATSNNTFLAL